MLSLEGRARRRDYIVVNLVVFVVFAILGVALEGRVEATMDRLPTAVGIPAAILFIAIALALSWVIGLALPVRRLHDMNLSGWCYLLILLINAVPFVGPIVGFCWLVFVPGTKGRNRFGADPRGPTDQTVANVFEGPPVATDGPHPNV